MKHSQRLDYNRLADTLGEKGLVEHSALQHVLAQSMSGKGQFPETLVNENLVSDWELARVACETFHLPFLPVDVYPPSKEASEGLDVAYLRRHGLVPLDRFGKRITVAMPVLVPTSVLTGLERENDVEVVPVVGCVTSNRTWLAENLSLVGAVEQVDGALPAEQGPDLAAVEQEWADIFDAGDAAVLLDLEGGSTEAPGELLPPEVDPPVSASTEPDSDEASGPAIDLPSID